jgi:hypothetical protein
MVARAQRRSAYSNSRHHHDLDVPFHGEPRTEVVDSARGTVRAAQASMRAIVLCCLVTGCVTPTPIRSLIELRGQTVVSIQATDTAVIDAAMPTLLPPTVEIDLDMPDCARFEHDAELRIAGQALPITNAYLDHGDCIQAQGRATFAPGTFTGQPVTIEIEDASDLWTITFDAFHNAALQFPTQLAVGQVAKMSWIGSPHIDNGCFRFSGNDGWDAHGCKHDKGTRFPPETAADVVELDVSPFWPQQGQVQLSMVAEYGGLGPPPRTCDGPTSCGVLLSVNRTFTVTVAH